jgi:selenocysteine lyase/cysteine desulfurase
VQEVAVPALAAAVSSAAELIGAEARDCVPVTNATTGITTVLAAVHLSPADAILTLSCAYSAVKTAIGRTAAAAGASVVEVEMDMQVRSQLFTPGGGRGFRC